MDGDGDIDVLAAKPGSPFGGGSVVIYRNNGNGSFTEQVSPSRQGKNSCASHWRRSERFDPHPARVGIPSHHLRGVVARQLLVEAS